jgi:hypothetical protein
MTVSGDLDEFAASRRTHGRFMGDTGAVTPNGYRLTVSCPCRVTFERWITPGEAARDLVELDAPGRTGSISTVIPGDCERYRLGAVGGSLTGPPLHSPRPLRSPKPLRSLTPRAPICGHAPSGSSDTLFV